MTVRVVSMTADGRDSIAITGGPILRSAAVLQVALLLLVVANLGRIPVMNLGERSAPLLVNDLAALAVLTIGGLAALRARSLFFSDAALAACVFIATGGITAVAAIPRFGLTLFELTASLAYLVRWSVYFGVYLVIINTIRDRDVQGIWKALELAMIVFVAFGVVQSIFLPDFGLMVNPDARPYYDIDPQGHRLVSTVLEPNIAAAMILTVLMVQIAQLACGVRMSLWKPAFLTLGLILTISRSGAFAFVCASLFIVAVRGLRTRLLKFATLAAIIVVGAAPFLWSFIQRHGRLGLSDRSAAARLITWERALSTFWDNKWFGIGFNTYGYVQEHRGVERTGGASYSAEGGLLFVAVMTGIVGLLIYCVMLWYVYKRCRWIWRNPDATPEQRGLALGAAAATLAICVHSIFVNSLMTPYVMEPLWVLWGLTFVMAMGLAPRAPSRVAP